MRQAIVVVIAAALSGCAAQPQYTQPTPVTPAIQQETADPCITAFAALAALSEVGTPLIKKCRAGDRLSCGSFSVLLDRSGMPGPSKLAVQCLEGGQIDPLHPLVLHTNRVLPSFNRELEGLNRELGIRKS
jgi:hypothetical protein